MNIDFFVVGSQRCGTTWVDSVLRSSKKIRLPDNKQTYFFDRNYSRGFDWYFSQFPVNDEKYDLVGEVATGYCLDGAIDKVAVKYPKAKLILIIREPVSRAYSNFCKRSDDYAGNTFKVALQTDYDLVTRGLYGDMLDRMHDLFPSNQIKVVYFEDLQQKPEKFAEEIFNFLEIDIEFDHSLLNQNVNSSAFIKLYRFLKNNNLMFLIKGVKKLGLTTVFRKIIFKINKRKKRPQHVNHEEFNSYFAKSNDKLYQYTKRTWL